MVQNIFYRPWNRKQTGRGPLFFVLCPGLTQFISFRGGTTRNPSKLCVQDEFVRISRQKTPRNDILVTNCVSPVKRNRSRPLYSKTGCSAKYVIPACF